MFFSSKKSILRLYTIAKEPPLLIALLLTNPLNSTAKVHIIAKLKNLFLPTNKCLTKIRGTKTFINN